MKTITAYKLSDGSIVENENEAIKTEKVLTFKNEMEKLVGKYESTIRFEYVHEFVEYMDKNAEKLFEILSKRFAK